MDDSEGLDLDSLLELMDDDCTEDEPNPNATGKGNDPSSLSTSRSLELRHAFEKALSPQRITSPKENQMPHDEYSAEKKDSLIHSEEFKVDSNDEGLSKFGMKVQKELDFQMKSAEESRVTQTKKNQVSTWKKPPKQANASEGNPSGSSCFVDSYSGVRIVKPLVSHDSMQQRMQGRRMIKMSFMKNCIRNGDIEGDWVTVGVLIGKLPTKQTKTGRAYSIWKMSDLHDPEKVVTVFLFASAHTDHWKTIIGTVIGILNPKVSQDKDKGQLTLTVDHPGKLMMMGTSKDFGHCKSRKKDGTPCSAVVNLHQCEYCLYHVKHEYQKFSGRSELQSGYTGKEPNLKNKILKKQNIIYGGQMFLNDEKKPSKQHKGKDKLTLSNLTLKRKADALENDIRENGAKKLAEMYGPEISKNIQSNSEFINTQLTIPTAGSRNLFQHLMKDRAAKVNAPVQAITAKELLKMRENQFASNVTTKRKDDSSILQNLTPQIGRGLRPGQSVSLDSSHLRTHYNPLDLAKLKAIKKIQEQGKLKAKNPNSVKVSPNSAVKVKAVLERSFNDGKTTECAEEKPALAQSKLGSIDLNSERVKKMLNRNSSHAYEVEMDEMEKEAAYFNAREKKERMEEKMASVTEIVCSVVSCKKCQYTAQSAAEKCIKETHPLKCHKALKRFFACKECKYRTCSFKRYPSRTCRKCKGSNFEHSSAHKPRSGPKLDSEILKIRGDEMKFINSLSSQPF